MKPNLKKHLWFYPIIFGFLGAFLGLIIRYFFTQTSLSFSLKNLIHSHSHVMLLGFIFNALTVLLWSHFSKGIDSLSKKYYLALQVCIGGMLIMFIIQGYALFSIIFSTLHLWISYIFLIRLWRRLEGNKQLVSLIKIGIIFHFISSIGPYCLGPLMVLNLQESPWYQQAIFFYLHFQYFGAFLVWLLVIFLKRNSIVISIKNVLIIGISLIGLYAHSLDYNFDHWLIQFVGGTSSILFLVTLFNFLKPIKHIRRPYQIVYYVLIIVGVFNIIGSFPVIASLVENNHYLLIAWLHFLFLGLFIPFIWLELSTKINSNIWAFYSLFVIISEAVLIFPNVLYGLLKIPITWLLFVAYLGVFCCIAIVHLKFVFAKKIIS